MNDAILFNNNVLYLLYTKARYLLMSRPSNPSLKTHAKTPPTKSASSRHYSTLHDT